MFISVSDEVKHKEDGQTMIVTGIASGMVECRWYDGYSVRREAFREEELYPAHHARRQLAS